MNRLRGVSFSPEFLTSFFGMNKLQSMPEKQTDHGPVIYMTCKATMRINSEFIAGVHNDVINNYL